MALLSDLRRVLEARDVVIGLLSLREGRERLWLVGIGGKPQLPASSGKSAP
jgi:hypothetical protein